MRQESCGTGISLPGMYCPREATIFEKLCLTDVGSLSGGSTRMEPWLQKVGAGLSNGHLLSLDLGCL